jgi:hypothetical protein
MKLLVLASEPVRSPAIRDALGADADGAEVRVVSPALNESPLAFWVSDPDEAIADADAVQEEVVGSLRTESIDAQGEVGDSDPLTALEDALATFAADRILVFARGEADEQRYREGDVIAEAERRFSLPVTLVPLGS